MCCNSYGCNTHNGCLYYGLQHSVVSQQHSIVLQQGKNYCNTKMNCGANFGNTCKFLCSNFVYCNYFWYIITLLGRCIRDKTLQCLQLGELVEVPGWHHQPLSSGTATPKAVPTWARQRRAESVRFGVVTGHAGVHRLGCGGAPLGHHHWVPGATTVFLHRWAQAWEVTAMVMAVHRPIFLERAGFRNLAGVVTATPRAMPPPCHVR